MNKKTVLFVVFSSWLLLVVAVVLCGTTLYLKNLSQSLAESYHQIMMVVKQHVQDVYFSGIPFIGRVFQLAGYYGQVVQLLEYAKHMKVNVEFVKIPFSLVGTLSVILGAAAVVGATVWCYYRLLVMFELTWDDMVLLEVEPAGLLLKSASCNREKPRGLTKKEELRRFTEFVKENDLRDFIWEHLKDLVKDHLACLVKDSRLEEVVKGHVSRMLEEYVTAERIQELASLGRDVRGHPECDISHYYEFPDKFMVGNLAKSSRNADGAQSFSDPDAAQSFSDPYTAQSFSDPDAAQSFSDPDAAQSFNEPDAVQSFSDPDAALRCSDLDASQCCSDFDSYASKHCSDSDVAVGNSGPDVAQDYSDPDVAQVYIDPDVDQVYSDSDDYDASQDYNGSDVSQGSSDSDDSQSSSISGTFQDYDDHDASQDYNGSDASQGYSDSDNSQGSSDSDDSQSSSISGTFQDYDDHDASQDYNDSDASQDYNDSEDSNFKMKSHLRCRVSERNSLYTLSVEGTLQRAFHQEQSVIELELERREEPYTSVEVNKLMCHLAQKLNFVTNLPGEWNNGRIRERLMECFDMQHLLLPPLRLLRFQ